MSRFSALPLMVLSLALSAGALAQTPPPATEAPPPPAPVAVTYKLDPAAGNIYVQVFKDAETLAASLSHDHVVKAKGWTGSVTWDSTSPATCKVELSLPVAQLENDAPDLRKKVGYDSVLDDGDRAEVKKHMLDTDQLNAAKFPTISFKATKCEGTGSSIKVSGDFTLHGVSKPVTVPMTITADGNTLTAKGSFKAKQSDYGITPFSALLGQLKNKDEMTFTIDVKGNKI